jgi:Luciferase-like monooxygenase
VQPNELVVGTDIAAAFSRQPIAAANAGRALSELYPDRFILGLGVSNAAANQRRGVRYDTPEPFMRDYLARMRAAPYMAPPPPAEPPIVFGSFRPKIVELAAAETAGVLTYFTPPEKTAQVRAVMPSSDPRSGCAQSRQCCSSEMRTRRAAAASWTRSSRGAPWTRLALGSRPTTPLAFTVEPARPSAPKHFQNRSMTTTPSVSC